MLPSTYPMRYDRPALLRRRLVGKLDTMPHEGIFMFGRLALSPSVWPTASASCQEVAKSTRVHTIAKTRSSPFHSAFTVKWHGGLEAEPHQFLHNRVTP